MAVKDIFQKIAFGAKKNKSEIMFFSGLVAIVAGTVICCRETLKTPDIVTEHKVKRDMIKKKAEENEMEYHPGKDLFKLYLQTTGKILWNYKWGIGLEALGFVLVGKGYSEKNKQYLGASAGLAAVSAAFDEYRGRAREKYGDKVDQELLTGESEFEYTDIPAKGDLDENGKQKKVTKKKLKTSDPNAVGDGYGVYICKGNPVYDDDEDYVLASLRRIQNLCNDKKNAALSKSIVLNDIYSELYCEKRKKGMLAGYIGNDHFVEFDVKKVSLPDEFGNFHDAYWVGFKNLKKNIYDDMEV